MWKANGKTTTLSLFLDSLFPKTEIYIIPAQKLIPNLPSTTCTNDYSHCPILKVSIICK